MRTFVVEFVDEPVEAVLLLQGAFIPGGSRRFLLQRAVHALVTTICAADCRA